MEPEKQEDLKTLKFFKRFFFIHPAKLKEEIFLSAILSFVSHKLNKFSSTYAFQISINKRPVVI